jgi:hypothetical protein
MAVSVARYAEKSAYIYVVAEAVQRAIEQGGLFDDKTRLFFSLSLSAVMTISITLAIAPHSRPFPRTSIRSGS